MKYMFQMVNVNNFLNDIELDGIRKKFTVKYIFQMVNVNNFLNDITLDGI